MRIVLDMQGAQTESRFRGIGRYALAFAQSIARNRGENDVFLALNGLLPDAIGSIRAVFDGLLPQENIIAWQTPKPVQEKFPGNEHRRKNAELIREAFLASLKPDVIHISSLFEGYVDDAVTSIGRFDTTAFVSAAFYDLIPLLNPDHYLAPDPRYNAYYQRKLTYLKRADRLLSISESTRREGINQLGMPEKNIVNISTAVEDRFRPKSIDDQTVSRLKHKFGLSRPFVLYTGGDDRRKNLPRLIRAFAALPDSLRNGHQLLFAGFMQAENTHLFKQEAICAGLKSDDFRLTGYVSDEELIALYNLCKLFVFPSWHEGFGLPALEAMACGAPVVSANTSSLPEVMDLQDAQFDPHDEAAISAKIAQALKDKSFRATLKEYGLRRAKRFSWDMTAEKAFDCWQSGQSPTRHKPPIASPAGRKHQLAFVSPLLPEKTGVASYSAELLPALAKHYDIHIVAAQREVEDPYVNEHFQAHDVQWFLLHAGEMDRVVYQMGNSPYHSHMLPLMRKIPGTVVMHDFYMSGLMHWLELHAKVGYAWTEALYAAHGYPAVRKRFFHTDAATNEYPVNLHILQLAQGVIFHSDYPAKLITQWYGTDFSVDWEVIPHLRFPRQALDRSASRKRLGLPEDDFIVCCFGFVNPTKMNTRLLDNWLGSFLSHNLHCRFIFVGENCGGAYGAQMVQKINDSGRGDRIMITGFVTPDRYRRYLEAADLAVQIRTDSRGETSGAVLDCMNHGVPVIVNANGAMAELDPDAVWMLPDPFTDAALVEAMETLWREPQRRQAMGKRARDIILNHHAPDQCARQYADAIERFHKLAQSATPALLRCVAGQIKDKGFPDESEIIHLSQAIAATLPLPRPARNLFLDISATCRNDLRTGIERAVRALVLALLASPPAGYRVEPVYLSAEGGQWHYRHACRFTLNLLGCPENALPEEAVAPQCGDILLGLDLSGDLVVQADQTGVFKAYRDIGVAVYFMVHDLLPVRMPEVFPPGADEGHEKWLHAISGVDGAICISKSVADDLVAWQADAGIDWKGRKPFPIGWSHHGADFNSTSPTRGMPANAESTLKQLRSRPSFLMVGTIEPRKGYLQAIEAFDSLWREGADINLVIVGKEGWKDLAEGMRRTLPDIINRLRRHPEIGRHLFWLEGTSDEYLEKIYSASSCLIAASDGEGFGLPLIEAARHKVPIIARDLQVFREVSGDDAFYFSGKEPLDLATALNHWMALYQKGHHPASGQMHCSTWQESAENLKSVLFKIKHWRPQFFLDVSELVHQDARSGIQRVVRSMLWEWLHHPPLGYRVEPVYAAEYHGYRYARRFKQCFLGVPDDGLADDPIHYTRGDLFFGLDLQPKVVSAQKAFYQSMRRQHIRVKFLVHDLLCVSMPEHFPPGVSDEYRKWLEVIAQCDGAVCVSRTVADELAGWMKEHHPERRKSLKIDWFHLGADIENSVPTTGLPDGATQLLTYFKSRLSFLMVGTLEPRKGHAFVLDAFEQLWRYGVPVNLVIVGKQGWMVDELVSRINRHPEFERRLFWLNGISDAYLEKIYDAATCLVAASDGEGFCLPIIESARHKLPIIAPDKPIFREVAGTNAFFFTNSEPHALVTAVQQWLVLHRQGKVPKSENIHRQTWQQSADQLLSRIFG